MEENKIKLSKKDVWKAFLKWTFFSHSNYNYERLQASGILQSMSHIPEKLYPGNKEEQKKFIANFYNYSFVGVMLDWIKRGMKESPEEMAGLITVTMHGNVGNSLRNMEKNK